jgi:RNA polymerase sigma factor for flagellar operon FliA
VRYTAQKMLGGLHASVERQDLVSWGTFGLMDAIERYDPDAGTKFSTFATYRIQGAINDEMRKQAWEPKSVRAKSRAVIAAAADLEHELGRSPTDIEVSTRVGISVEELSRIRHDMDVARVASLSSPTRGDDDERSGELGHLIEAVELGDVAHEFGELAASVATAITHLGPEDRDLMEWVYVQGLPFKDIARNLGVTESWVSHLHTRGMVRLQRVLSARY